MPVLLDTSSGPLDYAYPGGQLGTCPYSDIPAALSSSPVRKAIGSTGCGERGWLAHREHSLVFDDLYMHPSFYSVVRVFSESVSVDSQVIKHPFNQSINHIFNRASSQGRASSSIPSASNTTMSSLLLKRSLSVAPIAHPRVFLGIGTSRAAIHQSPRQHSLRESDTSKC